MLTPIPSVFVDDLWIAAKPVDDWQSIVMAGLQISRGSRASAADALPWPTATVKFLATSLPEYLVVRPQGRPVEIWIDTDGTRQRVFYGMAEAPRIRAVRTSFEGQEYAFEVTLPVSSRPAALAGVRLSEFNQDNNRGEERASTRLAWLNSALTTKNSPYIRSEFHHLTPLLDAPSGALGGFPYWVTAKDYRGASPIEAWAELAMTGAEFTEYFPHSNRLSARGRVSLREGFLRLGWVGKYVGIVGSGTVAGTVLQGGRGEMAEATYSDVGTVSTIRVNKYSRWTGGTWDADQKKWVYRTAGQGVVTTWPKNRRGLRRYELSTIGIERYTDPADPLGKPDGYSAAILARVKALVDDAGNPTHPPVKVRFTDGFEDEAEVNAWLGANTYDPWTVYVAGSVFNLRPGKSFHSIAGTVMTWEAYGTDQSKRRWVGTMALTPVENDGVKDALTIDKLNPSATSTPVGSLTYDDLPDTLTIASEARLPLTELARFAADSTATAFTYDDLSRTLTVDELRSVSKGL